MKAILRSLVVFGAIAATTLAASSAYFTANVLSTNNQITTGTMVMYVGTYQTPTGNRTGQWVEYADKNGSHQVGNFEAITNVEPGVTKSTYMVIANYGSLDFQYRASASGAWQNTTAGLNNSYMRAIGYYRFGQNNCEGDAFCEDIYYWLTDNGYTNAATTASPVTPAELSSSTGDSVRQLSPMEFTVYRMDWQLNAAAGNAYQGETYLYSVDVDGKQLTDSTF